MAACASEGYVVVCAVPWARHRSRFTRPFEDQTAWLAVNTSKKATAELMRIAWRTVGAIITRVWMDIDSLGDRLDGVRRIGIDEISYKRGYRYLTVVVCHDTGRLVWAAPGRDRATVRAFFDALGPQRSSLITHVSADQAEWIAEIVAERCPDDKKHIARGVDGMHARLRCASRVWLNALRCRGCDHVVARRRVASRA